MEVHENDNTKRIERDRNAKHKRRHSKKNKKKVVMESNNNNILKSIKCLITNEKYNVGHKSKIDSVVKGTVVLRGSQRILPACMRERCRTLHNIRDKYCRRPVQELKKPKKHKTSRKTQSNKKVRNKKTENGQSSCKDSKNSNKIKSTITLSLSSLTNSDNNPEYEDIMSVELFSSDDELDTLIRRARERDKKSTHSEQNQTEILDESTSYFDNVSEDDNYTVFTSDMDISLHSEATLVLDPLSKDAYSPAESPSTFNFNGFLQTANESDSIINNNHDCYGDYNPKDMFNDNNLRASIKQEVYSPSAEFFDKEIEYKNNNGLAFYQDGSLDFSKLKTEVVSPVSDRSESPQMLLDIKQEPLDISS